MGSYEEEGERRGKPSEKIVKAWIASLISFLMSIMGGLVLICWEIKFHPSNRQLWMVPFGLILFITPVFVCLAAFISDTVTVTTTKQAAASDLSTLKLQPALLPQVNSDRC